MAKTKLKFLKGAAGPTASYHPGEEYDVPASEAKSFIDHGIAEEVKSPARKRPTTKRGTQTAETATGTTGPEKRA